MVKANIEGQGDVNAITSATLHHWQPQGREQLWRQLQDQPQHWDLIVVGGGITGAGIAREAARRQLKVLLVERQDFAWGTSSRSSKMVHGGLRYMAMGDIKTTLHSVRERERLMREAPGLVDMMEYAMPHYKGRFPGPFIFNSLLWFYDLFAGKRYRRYVPASEFLVTNGFLEKENLLGATIFADAVTDDSRLVMRVLHEAQRDGAVCINYIGVDSLIEDNGKVAGVVLKNSETGEHCHAHADVVINATGAWVDELRGQLNQPKKIRPARGSHIVIDAARLPVKESFTILHPDDQRPIFVYPWEGRTVIGTTDLDNGTIPNAEASISRVELDYLLKLTRTYFPQLKLQESEIIASFSGVRPLIASGALSPSKEKRDHSVWHDKGLVSVSGGKLTTFRLIALDTLKVAKRYLKNWTNKSQHDLLFTPASKLHPLFSELPESVQKRLLGFYGAEMGALLTKAYAKELKEIPNIPILWAELRWAAAAECVQHLDDLLLRRTRVGLLVEQGGLIYAEQIQLICQQELGWDDARWQQEVERYKTIWQRHYSLPA